MAVLKKSIIFLVLAVFCFCTVAISFADEVADRITLEGILGTDAVTEGFSADAYDGFPANNTAYGLSANTLNSSTVLTLYGYYPLGPGLVVPGVSFTNLVNLNWYGANIWGQTSAGILGVNYDGVPGHSMLIDFYNPTLACGLDLAIITGIGEPTADIFTIKVYGADDSSLLYTSAGLNLTDVTPSTFWGYTDASGIGSIEILNATRDWSALIDNVTFSGTLVPEPVSSVLFLLGGGTLAFLKRRKKRTG